MGCSTSVKAPRFFRILTLYLKGNVGATEGGLPFLEEEEIIPAVLEIAEKSPIPSIRG